MGMNPSERAQFSAERAANTTIIKDLTIEREEYISTLNYIRELGEFYGNNPSMKGVLAQLQRHALLITNPNDEGDIPMELSQAFYWGEIVGYRAGQLLGSEDWDRRSYDVLNEKVSDVVDGVRQDFPDHTLTVNERAQMVGGILMGELEQDDELYLPNHLDQLIEGWAPDVSDNEMTQFYFRLGFRYLIVQITKDMVITQRALNFNTLLAEAGIEDENPDMEPITDIINMFIDTYTTRKELLKVTSESSIDKLTAASDYLNHHLGEAFIKQEQLEVGDDIIVKGDALYAVFNEDDDEMNIALLAPTEKLEGELYTVGTMEMPSLDSIQLFKDFAANKNVDLTSVTIDPLSPVMILKNGVTMTDHDLPIQAGNEAQVQYYEGVSSNKLIAVIFNNPSITISRYM